MSDEVAEVKITTDKVQFLYNVKEFTVKPGQKVKITLINPAGSVQPHNTVIVKPGTEAAVGNATISLMSNPEFLTTMNAVPESDDILFHSALVQPDGKVTLEFTVPKEAGDYPYICTYPGHWAYSL